MNTKRISESGFTLLEVLVAIVVLTFGLLGIAGLLLATVKNNTISAQRTTAVFLAQDMADRIRLNINATKPLDAKGNVQDVYYLNNVTGAANAACVGDAVNSACADRKGAADRDIYVWLSQLATSLPGGQGIVCKDLTPDDGTGSAAGVNGCDAATSQSPWVVKIFWVVRAEDQSDGVNATNSIQRLSMMVGGT
jgi:type IV pilus assembly protein PilV